MIENVCAHRGVRFCREKAGTVKDFTCPYHQWNYDLKGNLQGVPFRRGVKQAGRIHGGMPADFKLQEHGLTKLKVAARGGVVFASFDHDVEPFEDFLGPTILKYFDRLFNGRKLKILGYNRQRIPGNWKLMQENIKDPYHPGLLHTWFITFGLWRADNKSELLMDQHFRHAAMISTRGQGGKSDVTQGVSSFKEKMTAQRRPLSRCRAGALVGRSHGGLDDDLPECHLSAAGQQRLDAPYPADRSRCFRFRLDALRLRGRHEEMTRRRLRQANLFGPAGFVSADDGEVIEFSQESFEQKPSHRTIAELGGRDVADSDHMVTETLIRGMYGIGAGSWTEVDHPCRRFAPPPQDGGSACGPAEPDPRLPLAGRFGAMENSSETFET